MKRSLTRVFAMLALHACSADDAESARGAPRALRVYVSGESIEQRNRFIEPPFTASGELNDRGALRNDNDEYGWMVPFAERFALRDPLLSIAWVGTGTWSDADDANYTGTYPSSTPSATSAIAGTSIDSWLEARQSELAAKTFCYDVAFASRGGNDFGLDDDAAIKDSLKTLVRLLDAGSSCQEHPVIHVTGHMPDDQRGGTADPPDAAYVQLQLGRFVGRFNDAVEELQTSDPDIAVRFIDMYTPFLDNRATAAFPSETWASSGVPDYIKIGRENDTMHPKRLASIYAGECVADAVNLAELRDLP